MVVRWVGKATIEKRRDEIAHGCFSDTYVVHDRFGWWRGDFASYSRAVARALELEEQFR